MLGASAQLTVIAPPALVAQFSDTMGKIIGSTAVFGAPFYGQKVMGRLIWNEAKMKKAHCHEKDYDVPEVVEPTDGGERMINIVMVRRGICPFTRKVHIASSKGAHAVIFVDTEDSTSTREDLQNMVVGDDGYGGNIHIPSMLITNTDGAKLIEASERGEVLVELEWTVPSPASFVNIDYWMNAGSESANKFLVDFTHNRQTLNEVVSFQPHYNVFKLNSSDFKVFLDLCTDSSGEFCTEDPDGSGPVTGKDVLEESVRQLCIHELTKVKRGEGITVGYAGKWWDYIAHMAKDCPMDSEDETRRFGSVCAEQAMSSARLDSQHVNSCMMLTMTEKLRAERENKAWSPSALRINGWRYMGNVDADLVTQAICTAFIRPPPECEIIKKERDPFDVERHVIEKGVSGWVVLVTLLVIVGFFTCAMFFYKYSMSDQITRQVRDEVTLEVQSQMGEYSRMQKF